MGHQLTLEFATVSRPQTLPLALASSGRASSTGSLLAIANPEQADVCLYNTVGFIDPSADSRIAPPGDGPASVFTYNSNLLHGSPRSHHRSEGGHDIWLELCPASIPLQDLLALHQSLVVHEGCHFYVLKAHGNDLISVLDQHLCTEFITTMSVLSQEALGRGSRLSIFRVAAGPPAMAAAAYDFEGGMHCAGSPETLAEILGLEPDHAPDFQYICKVVCAMVYNSKGRPDFADVDPRAVKIEHLPLKFACDKAGGNLRHIVDIMKDVDDVFNRADVSACITQRAFDNLPEDLKPKAPPRNLSFTAAIASICCDVFGIQ